MVSVVQVAPPLVVEMMAAVVGEVPGGMSPAAKQVDVVGQEMLVRPRLVKL
jgi:hypothetical protein